MKFSHSTQLISSSLLTSFYFFQVRLLVDLRRYLYRSPAPSLAVESYLGALRKVKGRQQARSVYLNQGCHKKTL